MSTRTMPVQFEAEVETIDALSIVRLPDRVSRELPSRGQVAVHATIDGHDFDTVLEPDGRKGHWLRIDEKLRRAARVTPGESVTVAFEVANEWPEPDVPDDLAAALDRAPQSIREIWADITPMARWEWVRWVSSTANPDTRQRRVEVTISKIDNGKRRPCCFDLSSCTDPSVSTSGKLRDST